MTNNKKQLNMTKGAGQQKPSQVFPVAAKPAPFFYFKRGVK
jgi:hypothetical protein